MTHFSPDRRSGVLYDYAGNIVYKFGNLSTVEEHEVPGYVDMDRGPTYLPESASHGDDKYQLEAHPRIDALPDPTKSEDKQA